MFIMWLWTNKNTHTNHEDLDAPPKVDKLLASSHCHWEWTHVETGEIETGDIDDDKDDNHDADKKSGNEDGRDYE